MWDWLNQNSGGIIAVLTLILAAATLRYVLLTAALLRENIKAREAASRPVVGITTSIDEARIHILNLVIANWGNGPAFDVQFQVRQPVVRDGVADLSKVGVFARGLKYLGPHQRIQLFLASAIGNLDQLKTALLEIQATYRDGSNREFREQFAIDFGEFENISRVGEPPIYELAETAKELQKSLDGLLRGWTKLGVVSYTPEHLEKEQRVVPLLGKLRRLSTGDLEGIERLVDEKLKQ